MAGGLELDSFKVPSNLSHSVILWFSQERLNLNIKSHIKIITANISEELEKKAIKKNPSLKVFHYNCILPPLGFLPNSFQIFLASPLPLLFAHIAVTYVPGSEAKTELLPSQLLLFCCHPIVKLSSDALLIPFASVLSHIGWTYVFCAVGSQSCLEWGLNYCSWFSI